MRMNRWRMPLLAAACFAALASGCQSGPVEKDYDRQLPPGAPALLRVSPEHWPDITIAFAQRDPALREAMERSLAWFDLPSTRQHFPVQNITHEHAKASVFAFHEVAYGQSPRAVSRLEWLKREFDLWMSVGCDDQGTVLFTGYYTPIFHGSRRPTARYRYPLYRQPPQLVRPEKPGEGPVMWRTATGQLVPAPTRAQLSSSPMLQGNELVYLESPLDVYIVQVQGSARLRLVNRETMDIGYAADNGYDYTSIGQALIRDGKLSKYGAGLAAIRSYFQQHPEDLQRYLNLNDRFIFFQEYHSDQWPAGSLGFRVTPWRSMATDKRIFPRALPMLVDTSVPTGFGNARPLRQIMMDQDTGGAIRAPGRADIYMGIGSDAERVAGQQKHEGRMYYFVLKPQRLNEWLERMGKGS